MNWRWLIPIWGLVVAIFDYADNYANDYMDKKMLPIILYQLFLLALLILIDIFLLL